MNWLQQFEDGYEAFLSHLQLNRHVSVHTLRAYQNDTQQFMAWLAQQAKQNSALEPDKTLWRQYPTFLGQQGYQTTTLARKLSTLKLFFRFLKKEQWFQADALNLRLHRPKLPKPLPRYITQAEVQQLLAQLTDLENPLTLRNRAMIWVLFTSGIRVHELVGLNAEHIDLASGEMRIWGKGSRERLAFIAPAAAEALVSYWGQYPTLAGHPLKPADAVFVNARGGRLSTRSVGRMLAELGEQAQLHYPLHPHLFRHGFASHLLNQGLDLRVVQELLGHVSITSTQIYTHLNTARLRSAFLAAHPRARQ